MKRALLFFVAAAALAAEPGFKPLFDGKTLNGWDGDSRLWKVVDGTIVGSTEGVTLQANTFLIHKQPFRNFVLRLQMKLRNHNSGIQFRSEALPDYVVRGYQADAAENNYWGCIYEEKGTRGVMANGWKDKAEKVVKLKDWNDYEIRCEGDKITIKLNGLETASITDSVRPEGVIALQLHRGPAMEAYFRNIRIQELK